MSVIQLRIIEPQNGTAFPGVSSVHLRGSLESSGHHPLFYKWYSSLNVTATGGETALNGPHDNPFDFSHELGLGSHVITFTAKDTQTDSRDDLQRAKDIGMTGGPPPLVTQGGPPPPPADPCVIHVLLAKMLIPEQDGASSSKTSPTLKAEAPIKWGRKRPDGSFEEDPNYHRTNQIAYRWIFTPSGLPAGRPVVQITPAPSELTFVFPDGPLKLAAVEYHKPLPANLALGIYTLSLRVEDAQNPAIGHQVDRQQISITP